jgi:hypothetical protein
MIQRLARSLVLVAAALSLPLAATAQEGATGRLIGRVLEASTGRALSGAQVYVNDGVVGTLTDLNGRFVLNNVPAGTVEVTAQILGYATKSVTGVDVAPDGVETLDITVEETAVEVEGIVVEASRERGSQAFLLDERRTAAAVVEGVGSVEIGRRPDSDAAEVAQRLTGVTVSEGKYVFVRGLGERYSQTTLNGSSLPSPEPEREVVPLDLFPSGFLESLQTQKTYTPDLPADFSGGSVQIQTKDFPNRLTVRMGLGTSFNTNSHFKDEFLAYPGGGRDWLGFDDGSRDLPGIVQEIMGPVDSGQRLPADPEQRVAIGRAFQQLSTPFGYNTGTTPLNRSFNASVGGRNDFRRDGELGYFVAGTYSDSYFHQPGDRERKWRVSAFDPSLPEEGRFPNVSYLFTRGVRTVSWGTIGNFTIKPSPDQKISLRTTVNVSTEDEARRYEGLNTEDIGGTVRSDRARFISRLMLWGQLSGEHRLFADTRLEWRATAARATRDEPMLRESVYLKDGDEPFFLLPIGESGRYFWSDLTDDDLSGAVDYIIPFGLPDGEGSLKLGGQYRQRSRDFGARRLNWDFIGGAIEDIDAALADAEIVDIVRRRDQFSMEEVVEPGDLYGAEDTRAAGYALVDLPLGERLRAIGGLRVEQYDLNLTSRDSTLQELDQVDLAPSLNVTYTAADNVKIRGAVSRTVDRPEFRELAPFQFTEATSLRQLFGNPELIPADITSADLRVDWFPAPGEIISLGGFWKSMDNPIEQVFIAAASQAFSFQNAREAEVLGLEVDVQLGLDRISPALRQFGVQANYSWIDSEVEVRQGEGIFQPTNLVRPLEGQAPYVFNAGINWANDAGVEAGVFVNRFGDRLSAAGGNQIPDIYEQSRTALDATLGFPLVGGASAKIRATNLLDAEYRFEQEANGITQVQRLYQLGRTFSVSLSWEF